MILFNVRREPEGQAAQIAEAQAIWDAAVPIKGSLAETYLLDRCRIEIEQDENFVRFLSPSLSPERTPTIVFAVRDLERESLTAVWMIPFMPGSIVGALGDGYVSFNIPQKDERACGPTEVSLRVQKDDPARPYFGPLEMMIECHRERARLYPGP